MPIYEYRCEECAGKFEVLTSYANREQVQICPDCESTRTRVLVSTFAAFGATGEEASASLGGGGCGPGCCGGACHAN
jgi:putative FmdB family regulatory protein